MLTPKSGKGLRNRKHMDPVLRTEIRLKLTLVLVINLTSRIADKFHLVPPDTVENTDPRASQISIYQAGIH